MKKILVIMGTRPEAIKLCPLIIALKTYPEKIDCKVCVTGQHREMLDQVLKIFSIIPDIDLNLMAPNQTLGHFTAMAIERIDRCLSTEKPNIVVVQGDTTTVLAGALASFYNKIPVAHVEAGLRTWNMSSPWPEEANRVLTTRLSYWHFCPTKESYQNLLKEGVPSERIFITGNTVIDALRWALSYIDNHSIRITGLSDDYVKSLDSKKMVLITGHRRENFGQGFQNICNAIVRLAKRFQQVEFIYPVHLNPNVQKPVNEIIGSSEIPNIHLIRPLEYLPFVKLMSKSYFILTDSGGIQEEAPHLGKPVLVMRDSTERPEAVKAGTVRLVGSSLEGIEEACSQLLLNEEIVSRMACAKNPYGDGHAVERIMNCLLN